MESEWKKLIKQLEANDSTSIVNSNISENILIDKLYTKHYQDIIHQQDTFLNFDINPETYNYFNKLKY